MIVALWWIVKWLLVTMCRSWEMTKKKSHLPVSLLLLFKFSILWKIEIKTYLNCHKMITFFFCYPQIQSDNRDWTSLFVATSVNERKLNFISTSVDERNKIVKLHFEVHLLVRWLRRGAPRDWRTSGTHKSPLRRCASACRRINAKRSWNTWVS